MFSGPWCWVSCQRGKDPSQWMKPVLFSVKGARRRSGIFFETWPHQSMKMWLMQRDSFSQGQRSVLLWQREAGGEGTDRVICSGTYLHDRGRGGTAARPGRHRWGVSWLPRWKLSPPSLTLNTFHSEWAEWLSSFGTCCGVLRGRTGRDLFRDALFFSPPQDSRTHSSFFLLTQHLKKLRPLSEAARVLIFEFAPAPAATHQHGLSSRRNSHVGLLLSLSLSLKQPHRSAAAVCKDKPFYF